MFDPNAFEIVYAFITGSMTLALSAALMKKQTASLIFGSIGTLASFAAVILIIVKAGRPPIFGQFEIVMAMVCIMSGLGLVNDRSLKKSEGVSNEPEISPWVWGANVFLLFYLAFYPKTLDQDYYMYDDFWVVSFFFFRIAASAVFLFAALIFAKTAFHQFAETRTAALLHKGRNYLLVGSTVFLFSEFSGSLWCLHWYGDSWHWSRGFFKASIVFLCRAMFACHIPPAWAHIQTSKGHCRHLAGSGWALSSFVSLKRYL